MDRLADWWEDLTEHWSDSYWRADHPEVTAVLIAVVTGILGLGFLYLEIVMRHRLETPDG